MSGPFHHPDRFRAVALPGGSFSPLRLLLFCSMLVPPCAPPARAAGRAEKGAAGGASAASARRAPSSRPRDAGVRLHDRAASAVVALTCRGGGRDFYFGTGVVIDPDGTILTSSTVVPKGARDIRVYVHGGRLVRARLLLVEPDMDLALVRIRDVSRLTALTGADLAWLPLGASRHLRLGEATFALGNSFRSIETDDQVTICAGIVSGIYDLREPHPESKYHGPVIETSAALNNGMDGGPLIDSRGRIVGLLSLNFSHSRWLGTAVPIDFIKPAIASHHGWFLDSREPTRAMAGLELEEVSGRQIRVLALDPGGPAEQAGLRRGDRIVAAAGKELKSLAAFRELYRSLRPGGSLALTIERAGERTEVEITLWGRF